MTEGPTSALMHIVVLDTEGRGYRDNGVPSLVELAAVEIVGGHRTEVAFHTLLNPDAAVNPFAEAVHGLSPENLQGAPRFGEMAPAFLAFLGVSPAVAHGAGSDLAMLDHDLAVAGRPPLPPDRLACTERMAKRLLKADLSLDGLCDALGVDRGVRAARHGVLIDAELTADCLLALARLPGYAMLRGVHVSRAERRARMRTRCVLLNGRVVFTVENTESGAVQRIEAAVPQHPDTHEAIPGPDGVLRIVRIGGRVPENPDGAALLMVHDGEAVSYRLEDRRLVRVGKGDCRASKSG
ncbi:MAG TPA: exonuclease domain-containing protein [Azospirillum sp.]|nr:exonuclease domain-containing protein [Azospirillum sp.]